MENNTWRIHYFWRMYGGEYYWRIHGEYSTTGEYMENTLLVENTHTKNTLLLENTWRILYYWRTEDGKYILYFSRING